MITVSGATVGECEMLNGLEPAIVGEDIEQPDKKLGNDIST